MPDNDPEATPTTDVYAIHGAEPEVLAYAMAKYSRSALSLRESVADISAQRAEQFLNTFYFQYGHRSIADLAHVPFAIERLSLLAAIAVVDEQRWDGQERSTRYQDFRTSGWFTPSLGGLTEGYTAAIKALFASYDQVGAKMLEALKAAIPQPGSMKPDTWDRTLRARAFDVARYLLPLATNTSLGQIVNARTLENQVSRLLSSEFAEIRDIAGKLREAAYTPAWNVEHTASADLAERVSLVSENLGKEVRDKLLKSVRAAPTLVKYAVPNSYISTSRSIASAILQELMRGASIDEAPVVDLLDDTEPLEIELVTSLLYEHGHFSYRQLRSHVAVLTEARRTEITAELASTRGPYDELLRPFRAANGLRFDILMDIGGFRDMHRHRRCTQLLQRFTDRHGYEAPECPGQPSLVEAGLDGIYREAMDASFAFYQIVTASEIPEAKHSAQYCLPLGTRCRALFTMDLAEAVYIAELRSGPAGHFSYRRVAWEMYLSLTRRYPALSTLFRIRDVYEPVDLLRR